MARNVVRWEPMRDMWSLRDDFDRLFDSMVGRYDREREVVWAPAVDVEETKESVVVRAELPGMKKEDIKVSVAGDVLSISGERRWQSEEKNKTYHRVERAYGKFMRNIALPSEVQGGKSKASYNDGVLELVLPKSEEAKSHEISIQS